MQRGVRWAIVVYLVQIPVVVGYAAGWLPIHPIAVMLPLVGLINGRFEKRGREGLGLRQVRLDRVLLLALLWAVLSLGRFGVVSWLEGAPWTPLPLSTKTVGGLAWDFVVAVFVIALWEEIVSRGYVQTRLQEAWGLWGVAAAALLFASLHVPSALLASACDAPTALYRFVQTGLAGFLLGYVYWRTGSVLASIAVHGLGNFALGVSLWMTGLTETHLLAAHRPLQLLWMGGQVGVALLLSRALFSGGSAGGEKYIGLSAAREALRSLGAGED
ncbi:MAG TPA: CPBP family intramembrane metalloprotease [Thermoflexia bacterium]|jgi:membrane protease YdiL (CAAX protease family)|nr:CPBP family intramembrane metalloprotease [Thermoflexia bacterium]